MKLTPAEKEYVIRQAGTAVAEATGETGFAMHLAAHCVLEKVLTGACTKTVSMDAPCPYCGKLPPGWVVPRSVAVIS